MASSTLVQQRTSSSSNGSHTSSAARPRTSTSSSSHASPLSRTVVGASSPSPRLSSTIVSSASKASLAATGSSTMRGSNSSVPAHSPPATPTTSSPAKLPSSAALASQNKKKAFDEIDAVFAASSKPPLKPTTNGSSDTAAAVSATPPAPTSTEGAASVPAAPASSPAGGANGYASLSADAIEAQRIATELEDLHANIVLFTETAHVPRKVAYEPVNKPGVPFVGAAANSNGKRANGLVAPLPSPGASSAASSPDRPLKKQKTGASGAPVVKINAREPSSSQGNGNGNGSSSKDRRLYTKKLSFKMPGGVSKRAGGLVNFGNSCYMNSVLQSLIHLPPLAYALIEQSEEVLRGASGSPANGFDPLVAMKNLTHKLLMQGATTQPRVFNEKLKTYAKSLRKGHQEDAHEFMRHLLEAMHQCGLPRGPRALDTKDPLRFTTLIHQIFGGRLRSRVTCLKCKAHSDTFDPILDLSLDIRQSQSLEQALKTFTTVERLHGTGNDRYKCEACKSRVTAEKRFTIDALPRVLTIHFKRFTPLGTKLSRKIDYPTRLRIAESVLSENASPATYVLHAVVHHHGGGPNSGHYVADVKAPAGQGWCNMNDSHVSSASPPKSGEKSAYLLFYVMEQEGLTAATSNALASSSNNATPARTTPFKSPGVSALAERQGVQSSPAASKGKRLTRSIAPLSDEESEDEAPEVESSVRNGPSRKRFLADETEEEDLVDVAEQKRLERQATALLEADSSNASATTAAVKEKPLSAREERVAAGLPSGFGKQTQRKPSQNYSKKASRMSGGGGNTASPYAVGNNSFDRPKGKKNANGGAGGGLGSMPTTSFYSNSSRKSSSSFGGGNEYGEEDTGAPAQRDGYESLSGPSRKKKKALDGRWDAGFEHSSGVKDRMRPKRN